MADEKTVKVTATKDVDYKGLAIKAGDTVEVDEATAERLLAFGWVSKAEAAKKK